MKLQEAFKEYISAQRLFEPGDKLLLAVSGGIDSVVLCELCKQSGYQFAIAHCNFGLRGAESDRDEQFVQSLATKYNVSCWTWKPDTHAFARQHKLSVQVAARRLRYEWFDTLLRENQLNYLLTGHHIGDNIETSLFHFFRGTGIAGLRGMLPKTGNIIRPLLFASREDIGQFAQQHQLQWVDDSSNATDNYSRNYLRHQVIPLVKKILPEAEQNLAANLQRFAETEQLYRQAIALHKKKLVELKGNELHIPVLKLQQTVPLYTVLYEIVKEYGFESSQTREIIALLDSQTGRYVQSSSHRVFKNRKWLIIAPLQSTEAGHILIEQPGAVPFGHSVLHITAAATLPDPLPATSDTVCIDASAVTFPLLLRKWKAGDYFYPLGMQKKKKLARFFIDTKLSKTDKENVWVLEVDKKIIWVLGHRIDDRFKVTGSSKNFMQLSTTVIKDQV